MMENGIYRSRRYVHQHPDQFQSQLLHRYRVDLNQGRLLQHQHHLKRAVAIMANYLHFR